MTPAEILNYVVNQPEVLRYVAPGIARVDLSNFFNSPGNIFMGDESGVLLFGQRLPGIYEMHYLFTEALRGREALLFTKDCIALMFTEFGALAIGGAIARDNRAARAMTRALGFRPCGDQLDQFGRSCIKYILEREAWATSLVVSSAGLDHTSGQKKLQKLH